MVRTLRTIKIGFWLGWQVQSNWTDPLLFFIYSIARPLGGVLILVFMFFIVAGGRRGDMLDFFVVGAGLWPLVLWTMQGVGWAILEDREQFRMVRYIYTAPIPFWSYLVGRGLAYTVIGTPAVLLTLGFGVLVLKVPIVLAPERLPYAAAAMVLGIAGLLAIGMMIAGAVLMTSGEAWNLPDAVGQALYLVCGAIFPITVLPGWLQRVASLIPITYWLEAMRRVLLPQSAQRSLPGLSDTDVLAALAVTTAAAAAVAVVLFVGSITRARQKGILDAESWY